MSTSTKPITLKPDGFMDSDGKYILDNAIVVGLLNYVWTGVLLATNKDDYMARTGITLDHYSTLSKYIDPLLDVYKPCQAHCQDFKDNVYGNIVDLSHAVKDYAHTAGGTAGGSFYANIIKYGNLLYDELQKPTAQQDQANVTNYRDAVTQLVDTEIDTITKLQGKAAKAKQDLMTFQQHCMEDQTALDAQNTLITTALTGDNGDLTQTQAQLISDKAELSADQDEYKEDIIIAATAITYVWCYPIGTIIAGAIMGVYGARAAKMKATIDAIKELIEDDNDKIAADKNLIADLGLIKDDLRSLIAKIDVAVQALEGFVSVWGNIAGDLQAVKDATQDYSGTGNKITQGIEQQSILDSWNELHDKMDVYCNIAYITAPEQVTLDSYAAALDST
ncbi:hypothetical protein BGAL_0310g00010 [Botrytis galanthina]|uniref:Pesticidal crystal protein cry6Aa n=1 Tax=Botrytis galanthina TaxID=278940 RepID=A0A4S8QR24_9HELO|nr:hypothetical protein BGAL_0310g00010 [Botrytis galanthina]